MNEIIREIKDIRIIEYAKTNIFVIENIMDTSFCELFIDFINTMPNKKLAYEKGNNVECFINDIDNLMKKNEDLYYSFPTDISESQKIIDSLKSNNKIELYTNINNGITKLQLSNYKCKINEKIKEISEIMESINDKIKFDNNTGYIFRKIYGTTRLHMDGLTQVFDSNITFIKENKKGDYYMARNATIIFTLNDDYEGGEFIFPYYDVTIKLKKGSVLIFPPYWTHQHQTNDLINNTYRYTITTWACEKI